MLRQRIVESLQAVPAGQWNALVPGNHPFVSHEFLSALETTGCVGGQTGWQPCHLLLEDEAGSLQAAAPLYRKRNSIGEFVFDFAWAEAAHHFGCQYYPKLVCAVPFTPVVGPRLLAGDDTVRAQLLASLLDLPGKLGASSIHLLFARNRDRQAAAASGALLRRDCHYHWQNRNYSSFDDFLAVLTSKRRKEIRRERRRVAEAGIRIHVMRPEQIDARCMDRLYIFYARTYLVRGQAPYLTRNFFTRINQQMASQVLYFVAYCDAVPVGMAFMLHDSRTLYGRHWGCLEDYHSLHFETCYYAGINYCIEHGLQHFDAGAQGEHKLRRGFEPVATYSAHHLLNPQFRSAVARFLQQEIQAMAAYHQQQRDSSDFPCAPELQL